MIEGQPTEDGSPGRLLAVTVGTDHHRFDRLMDWTEQWLRTAPGDVRVVAQHGTAAAPVGAEGHAVLPHDTFIDLLASADVVVTQGGPSTIMEALGVGRRPLAVPRLHRLNEAVNDHQIAFCRRMQTSGLVCVAQTQKEFVAQVNAMLDNPTLARAEVDTSHIADAIGLTGGLIDQLVAARARRSRWRTGFRNSRSSLDPRRP